MELKERIIEGATKGIWFETETSNGIKFSVVDLGKLMSTSPLSEETKKFMFAGWEAMILKDDGVTGDPIRAESWEGLKAILKNNYERVQ